jgi:hypothetical protein
VAGGIYAWNFEGGREEGPTGVPCRTSECLGTGREGGRVGKEDRSNTTALGFDGRAFSKRILSEIVCTGFAGDFFWYRGFHFKNSR